MKGEFEKQIKRYDYDAILAYMDINEAMKTKWITHNDFLKLIDDAKKEFPFSSWLKEDLEELKITIKRSIKERGHSVLDDEVSEEFIKTLDAIVKWFGTK